MTHDEALDAFTQLCKQLSGMISGMDERIKRLENKQVSAYTQTQVAEITGWSVAAIGKWLESGFIKGVEVPGRKKPMIPPEEVDRIIAKKGRGHKFYK